MARVILPNFDYQPDDTSKLNWDEAPRAPDTFQFDFDWDDDDWDKSYGGLVWAAELRDGLFRKYGVFGTFRTPVLLDEAGFRKLCYLVVGDDDLRHYADGKYDRQSFVTTILPKNYLPFKFYHSPLWWARNQLLFREGAPQRQFEQFLDNAEVENVLRSLQDVKSKRSYQNDVLEDDLFIDEDGQLVKTNDQVRLVNCSEKKLNGTIGTVYYHELRGAPSMVRVYVPSNSGGTFMSISIHNLRKFIPSGTNLPLVPPKHVVDWSRMPSEGKRKRDASLEVGKKVGLCDLSTELKQHIASYLPLLDFERNLRRACRDSFWNFRKPPPDNLEYDFVYFSLFTEACRDDVQWHGVAHTTKDVLVAIRKHDWGCKRIGITLKFVKFDRKHPIVPLFNYGSYEDLDGDDDDDDSNTNLYDYRGFPPASFDPFGCHYCGVQQASHVELNWSSIVLQRRHDQDRVENADHWAVFRHCRDWTPREPRVQLRHFGARRVEECAQCGYYRCDCGNSDRPIEKVYRIYYSPEWFERNTKFAFSAPPRSRDKSVIMFPEIIYAWELPTR